MHLNVQLLFLLVFKESIQTSEVVPERL